MLCTLALVPVLQRHEGDGRVLAVAAERETQHANGVLDLRGAAVFGVGSTDRSMSPAEQQIQNQHAALSLLNKG